MSTRDDVFPKAIQLAAQHAQRETGCPAAATLAQWALESDYGKALSGKNNPFGIKGPGTECHTEEVVNGHTEEVEASFRDFNTLEEAFEFHGHMLTRLDGWYGARVKPFVESGDWRGFIQAIALPHTPAYATDPNYATKLIAIAEEWELEDFNLAKAE